MSHPILLIVGLVIVSVTLGWIVSDYVRASGKSWVLSTAFPPPRFFHSDLDFMRAVAEAVHRQNVRAYAAEMGISPNQSEWPREDHTLFALMYPKPS